MGEETLTRKADAQKVEGKRKRGNRSCDGGCIKRDLD